MNTKHLIIFMAILAAGLLVEGLKGIKSFQKDNSNKISTLAYKDLDAKPFFISQAERKTPQIQALGGRSRKGLQLAANSSAPKNILAAPAKKESVVAKAVEKNKKKKSARKKGKVKSTEDQLHAKKYPESENKKIDDQAATSAAQTFVAQFSPAQKSDNELPITFEDWAKLILGSPQPENVKKLIEFFANNMVSPNIFYSILNAMLEEPNAEQHTLAVYAAGNAPNPQSFIFLVQVLKSETQGSTAAVKASEQINSYQTAYSVVYLKSVLSTQLSDVNLIQVAVNVLDKSTQIYLENRSPSANAEPTTSSTTSSDDKAKTEAKSKVDVNKTYAGFEPILERVIQTYKSQPEIADPAQRSLTRIKKLTVVLADTSG